MKKRNQLESKKSSHDRKGRWRAGVSGNPGGRPKGARNKTTMAAMALLEGEAEMLTQRAIDAAREGDINALKLVLDRIIPPRRRPIVQVDLDKLDDFQDVAEAHRQVIQAALDGGLSLDEAERLSKLIMEHMQATDVGEYEWRAQRYLTALFQRSGENLKRLKKLEQTIASGNIATNDSHLTKDLINKIESEQPKLPEDTSLAATLFVAALAYKQDCDEHEPHIERAWSALPPSERERVREAQKYFPFVEIPEE